MTRPSVPTNFHLCLFFETDFHIFFAYVARVKFFLSLIYRAYNAILAEKISFGTQVVLNPWHNHECFLKSFLDELYERSCHPYLKFLAPLV
ncbi:hypothetical protein UABAM_00793 [Candidatus Uabimicrobium amorphum]|uniref:Uncharacterized protein n=1 Tax=Uabimicrobium amorphum TaxID=2596890 RepID=A0A5S9IJ28_UABAM|nr:hypothetical protein UABAM_00793 [Candidatus Uabimicrobium amorphum]